MKKNTYVAIVSLLADMDFENKEAIMDELYTEINRGAVEKARKADEYQGAWTAVRDVLESTTAPLTANEIFESAQKNLPEGFTRGRVQYGLTHTWKDAVVKIEGKPNTYRLA